MFPRSGMFQTAIQSCTIVEIAWKSIENHVFLGNLINLNNNLIKQFKNMFSQDIEKYDVDLSNTGLPNEQVFFACYL